MTEPLVEGKPVQNHTGTYTTYIIPLVNRGDPKKPVKNYKQYLYLSYSYDNFSNDFMFRKHTAYMYYKELIKELIKGIEKKKIKIMAQDEKYKTGLKQLLSELQL